MLIVFAPELPPKTKIIGISLVNSDLKELLSSLINSAFSKWSVFII